ncbi:hypothetical protein AVEN_242904-1 [Araneus ventricosus]|uniref:Uncharacterized protein n=1 Tax=Araneus ventricosus TaxID=182803 RepID=A0A4Y2H474_ARAVE|nr:hypothetical protein AVEN_242904-1 [Araneus ventricosus]
MTTPLLAVQPSWTKALKSVYPKFGVATIASNLNSVQYVYGFPGRWTAASHPPHKPFPELRVALTQEWAAFSKDKVDNLVFSINRRCTYCFSAHGKHITVNLLVFFI